MLAALLCLYSWCFVMTLWLFLTKPQVCLQFVIVVFPDHTYLLFLIRCLRLFKLPNEFRLVHNVAE